jgi:hypothetical protein
MSIERRAAPDDEATPLFPELRPAPSWVLMPEVRAPTHPRGESGLAGAAMQDGEGAEPTM